MNGSVLLWDVDSNRPALRLNSSQSLTNAIAFSADGNLIATGGMQDVQLWDVSLKRIVCRFTHGPGQFNQYKSPVISPDGSLLATGGDDGNVRLWEIPEALRRNASASTDTPVAEMTMEISRESRAAGKKLNEQ